MPKTYTIILTFWAQKKEQVAKGFVLDVLA